MTTEPAESARRLRGRAENKLILDGPGDDPVTIRETFSPEETQRHFHELQVHQIELEMQNEELRRTQNEMEALQARYFDLYDLAPIGYLTISEQGMILESNLAAASILGMDRGELVNRAFSRIIFHEDREIYHQQRLLCTESNAPQVWDMRLIRASGSLLWAHLRATPSQNGEYWITLSDITDQKHVEQEKQELEQQLHQARNLESLGVLAGGIAHDFNNILAIIICYCSLAEQKPETAGEYINEIEKAAGRATELCRQMLAYAGKTQYVQTRIKMPGLVADMIKMLQATIHHNVTITADISADIPSITGDASQIKQVIMNLVINASEAIGEAQGKIRVVLSTAEICSGQSENDHLGKAVPIGSYVALEVSDTGCGMSDETRRRIFEPFYSTKFTGRGLGLSAVLGIITSHGGALQLSSQPGHGSHIKVYLPVESGDTIDKPLQQASPVAWRGSGTVLLVEDEPQLMQVAKALLNGLGFDVLEAINGREALELYRKNVASITLVLTDIGMPVMDGYELIRELNNINPDVPIIVSSGYGDAPVTSRIEAKGVSGFLSKPYSFDQLRAVLKGVVEKKT